MMRTQTLESDTILKVECQCQELATGPDFSLFTAWVSWPVNEQKNTSDNVVRANALFEIQNDLDSIIVDESMTSQDQKAYLSKLSNLKTLAQKNNLPTDAIDKKIKEVKRETEQATQEKPESVAEEDFEFELKNRLNLNLLFV